MPGLDSLQELREAKISSAGAPTHLPAQMSISAFIQRPPSPPVPFLRVSPFLQVKLQRREYVGGLESDK